MKLLNEMYAMALKVIELKGQRVDDFKIGYHAEPSMQQLHLHVISTDFNSPSLKTKKHWNSFNTAFFVSHHGNSRHAISLVGFTGICLFRFNFISFHFFIDMVKRIEVDGKVAKLDPTTAKSLLGTPLKCHRCKETLKTIPALKSHLLKHI